MSTKPKFKDDGKSSPYPMGPERKTTCEAIAAVVRAYRNEFRLAATLTNTQPV